MYCNAMEMRYSFELENSFTKVILLPHYLMFNKFVNIG